jgi:hypothetical protein
MPDTAGVCVIEQRGEFIGRETYYLKPPQAQTETIVQGRRGGELCKGVTMLFIPEIQSELCVEKSWVRIMSGHYY